MFPDPPEERKDREVVLHLPWMVGAFLFGRSQQEETPSTSDTSLKRFGARALDVA